MSCPFVNEMGACGSPLCPSEIAVGYTVVRSKSPSSLSDAGTYPASPPTVPPPT